MAIKLSITASWAKRVLADSDRKMEIGRAHV